VAIMTDSDNTRSLARAWYGPVRLSSDEVAVRP
jgi:ribosomal protein S28E/S33